MKPTTVVCVLAFAHHGLANIHLGPSLMDQITSPVGARALLEKRDICDSGNWCLYNCCGYDQCAFICCGLDMTGQGVGCGFGQSCEYAHQSVFIGCCDRLQIGTCTGTATMITMSTIYGGVTTTDEPSSTSQEPSTLSDDPTKTSTLSTTSRTPLPTFTSSNSSSEEPIETSTTDSSTTTTPPPSSVDQESSSSSRTPTDDSTVPDDLTSAPAPMVPETTQTDAAAVVNPSMWFVAGLGAMLAL
ncbi:hypothetical protein BJX63DRAFT_406933 [Aspergillus granulosus]|uniref:GPI anchored protein n=1 Tax=Aspergillus granulosus TaxID=176169 RepID=A0ABR4H0R5_9EURO